MATKNGYILEASGNAIPIIDSGSLRKEETAVHALDSNKLGGKAPQYYIQPRNLLDNSDFRNPINQRGQTSYGGSWLYSIDRWLVETTHSQSSENIIWIDDGYVNMFYYHELLQYIPLKVLKGKTFTFVACGANGMTLMNVIVPQNYGSGIEYYGSNWEDGKYILEAIKFENQDNVTFRIRSNYNGWQALYWAALYEGEYTADNLPPYVPKGYAVELAECQRYNLPFITNAFLGCAIVGNDGISCQGFISHNKMRIDNPTINGELMLWDGNASTSIASITVGTWQGNGTRINLNAGGQLKQGSIVMIYASTAVSFNADL